VQRQEPPRTAVDFSVVSNGRALPNGFGWRPGEVPPVELLQEADGALLAEPAHRLADEDDEPAPLLARG
jgi:hypothetical protein